MPLFSAVSRDSEEALKSLLPWGIFLATLPHKLEEAGYYIKELNNVSRDNYFDELRATKENHDSNMNAGAFITEDMVQDFFITGTVDERIDRIEKFREAGMNHLLLINVGSEDDTTLSFYENEIIPYFKE